MATARPPLPLTPIAKQRHFDRLDRLVDAARARCDLVAVIALEQRIKRDVDAALIMFLSR